MNKITTADPAEYHRLFGALRKKAAYFDRDFVDYFLMLALTCGAIRFCHGRNDTVLAAAVLLCLFMLIVFPIRHGFSLRIPLLLKRPQDALYALAYKLMNIRPPYVFALAVLLLENLIIRLTPDWPHHTDLMRQAGLFLFYAHFAVLTGYRTVSLISHLRNRELVREVLIQTQWRKSISERTSMTLEILHAYFTGILAHITLIAPWYFVITHLDFSLLLLPATWFLNRYVRNRWTRVYNRWFYRDHWLGHNSELEFLYLHGPHHDAIPSGLIGVAGNGFLEGLLRQTFGVPSAFYTPPFAFLSHSITVKMDIDLHQYIPGIFPKLPMSTLKVIQHSSHHFGLLEPYGIGNYLDQPEFTEEFKKPFRRLPDEMMNSIQLDMQLTGFHWDNPTYRQTLALFEKYHGR